MAIPVRFAACIAACNRTAARSRVEAKNAIQAGPLGAARCHLAGHMAEREIPMTRIHAGLSSVDPRSPTQPTSQTGRQAPRFTVGRNPGLVRGGKTALDGKGFASVYPEHACGRGHVDTQERACPVWLGRTRT